MSPLPVSSQTDKAEESQEVNQTNASRREFMFGLGSTVARQEQLLFSDYLSDVVFKVGSTGELIHAHKMILTVASEVFYAQFNGGFDEAKQDNRQNPIVIEEVEPEIFKQVLRYIYCEKVDLSPENIMDVYCVSEKYLLTDLSKECVNFLTTTLTVENVLKVFDSNRRYGFENVDELCLNIIQDNPIACFERDNFLTMSQSALELIAACPTMNCQKKQFRAAIRKWCEANNSEADIIPEFEAIQCEKLSSFSNFRYDVDIDTDLQIKIKGKMYLYGLGVFVGSDTTFHFATTVTVTVKNGPGNTTVSRVVTIKKNLYTERIMFEKLTITDECRITVTFTTLVKYILPHAMFCLEQFQPVNRLGALELTVTDMKVAGNVTPSFGSFHRHSSFGDVQVVTAPPKRKTNCVAYLLYGLDSNATC